MTAFAWLSKRALVLWQCQSRAEEANDHRSASPARMSSERVAPADQASETSECSIPDELRQVSGESELSSRMLV